jgi:hypothetical protein
VGSKKKLWSLNNVIRQFLKILDKEKMKKIFIISIALLGVTLFFLGVYNFAFKKNDPVKTSPQTQTEDTTKTAIVQKTPEKITAVSDRAVISPVFDKKNEAIIYYSAKDGTVWSIDPDGNTKNQISSTVLTGLKSVAWSYDRSKVLTKIEKTSQASFYEYDYQTKKGTLLKDGLDTVAWDNVGSKIIYKYYDVKTKKRSLNIANPDGSGWQNLVDSVPYREISIAPVPLTSLISYWNSSDASEETQLQTVGLIGGQPETILKGRFGADYLWSPDGKQALVSSLASKDSKMVTLGLVTLDGKYNDLNIPTTVSKCVWSFDGKTLYYALPGGVPDKAVMPNDYQDNKFNTEDTFWKMDIATGQKDRVIGTTEISGKYDSSNLFLSPTQGALYFVNKIDGKLYRIVL